MKAELWSDAHQLLTLHVAPGLLLASHHPSDTPASQEQQQLESNLQDLLQHLQPHANEIDQQCETDHSGLIPWGLGAGLYADYHAIRVGYLGLPRHNMQQ